MFELHKVLDTIQGTVVRIAGQLGYEYGTKRFASRHYAMAAVVDFRCLRGTVRRPGFWHWNGIPQRITAVASGLRAIIVFVGSLRRCGVCAALASLTRISANAEPARDLKADLKAAA